MRQLSAVKVRGTRDRILASAAMLFARFGYNGASTKDIALAAGVNEVTIYRHFPHKKDLYVAALESELQTVHLRGDLLAQLAKAHSARNALDCTFTLVAAALMQKPDLIRLIQFSALDLGKDLDPLIRKHLRELIEVMAVYLRPWIINGDLRCTSPTAVILVFVAIVFSHGSLRHLPSDGTLYADSPLALYAELCAALSVS